MSPLYCMCMWNTPQTNWLAKKDQSCPLNIQGNVKRRNIVQVIRCLFTLIPDLPTVTQQIPLKTILTRRVPREEQHVVHWHEPIWFDVTYHLLKREKGMIITIHPILDLTTCGQVLFLTDKLIRLFDRKNWQSEMILKSSKMPCFRLFQ